MLISTANLKNSTQMKTHTLDLSPGFSPIKGDAYVNYKFTTFHGGEPHFAMNLEETPTDDDVLYITQRFNSGDDIVLILVAGDAARRAGFKRLRLILPYFPAARQDRVCNPGESLTVKVFADLINSVGFEEVTIYSPHSEVTPALLNNCKYPNLDEKYIVRIIEEIEDWREDHLTEVNIVCPDAGAGKRVSTLTKVVAKARPSMKVNLIRCEKVRDVATGELKEFYVATDDLGGHPTIICDDIVSMGGTFIGLGNKLIDANCGSLILFTSHADAQEGLEKMTTFFDAVYTTNSKRDWKVASENSFRLRVFNIKY